VGQGPGVVDPCGFVPAGGVCRQRRNLGRTQVVGVKADAGVRLGGGFELTAAWLWSDAEIRRASAEPALEGNRVPQVPRHQGTIGLALDRGGPWWAAVQLRVVGEQFDDDANTRRLDRFVTADLFASRELGRGFEVYVAAENVFDEVIESGRSADGVVSIAAPRIARIGLRYAFSSDGS